MYYRFKPPDLNTDQVQEALSCLQLFNSRREAFKLGNCSIRLLVDGDQHFRFRPVPSRRWVFTIPADSGFMELRGDDDQGDILLAAFIVPECLTSLDRLSDKVAFPHTKGGLMEIEISWLRQKARSTKHLCNLWVSFVNSCSARKS